MLGKLIGLAVASEAVSSASTAIANAIKNRQTVNANVQAGTMLTVGIGSDDFIGMNYREAVKILIGAGFTNIDVCQLRECKNNARGRDLFGTVSQVRIGGDSDFSKRKAFPSGSYVVVEFYVFKDTPVITVPELEELKKRNSLNDPSARQSAFSPQSGFSRTVPAGNMLTVGIDSREFIGKGYKEAINLLIGAGFRNITAREIRTYNNDPTGRSFFGRVQSVSISGIGNFSGTDVFPVNSFVVVAFHVFRNSPHIYIPELEELKKNPPPQPVVTGPRFCDYCENEIDSSCVVCPHCGAFLK